MAQLRLPALILLARMASCTPTASEAPAESAAPEVAVSAAVSAPAEPIPEDDLFATTVLPLLERRCTPCHFPGGVMHAKLPFDDPSTIETLGERLFTRVKNPAEQQAIRAFLASRPEPVREDLVHRSRQDATDTPD